MNFEELWALKPEGRSKVYVYDKEEQVHKEKVIFRSYRSYLQIPPFNPDLPKSYMYDGLEPNVPNALLPILKDAWKKDSRFNQMVVNWYEPKDYIEAHRDCDAYFIDDYQIGIFTLNEPRQPARIMEFIPVEEGLPQQVLLNDGGFSISKDENIDYRHRRGSGEGRRISFTFRMLKEIYE